MGAEGKAWGGKAWGGGGYHSQGSVKAGVTLALPRFEVAVPVEAVATVVIAVLAIRPVGTPGLTPAE